MTTAGTDDAPAASRLDSVAEHFPYAAYRPGQREALAAARAAFEAGKRFVIVEAPTGSGKSGIAVTLAREARSAYVLTAQKLLQNQYARDFPDLAVVKGRSNYPCLVVDTHAAAAPCMAGRGYPVCEECSYWVAKRDAMSAHAATLNYPYFLAETNHAGGFGRRDLLVLDEAHNTEDALMRFVEVLVSGATLARAGLDLDLPVGLDLAGKLEFAASLLPPLRRAAAQLDARLAALDIVPTDLTLHRVELGGLIGRLGLLGDGEGWVCEEGEPDLGSGRSGASYWRFRPVRVAELAHDLLFRHAERVLFLSATILDAPTFLRALGIRSSESSFVGVPSSFPVRHRPVYPLSVARLGRDTIEAELPRVAAAVSRLLDQHPEKGVVHAHSYRILRFLTSTLPDRHRHRLVYHLGAPGREDALSRHLAGPEGSVLLTPSMTDGIDLADDRARWQVIVKVPYPYLGDPQVAARRAIDPEWYEWRTALRLVQAYGRVVRGPHDHAVTYVLDAAFPGWVARQAGRLPAWFLEAVAPPSAWPNVEDRAAPRY